ncbi:MAG: 30S ribosomal protein S3 [Clostridiales bacterium]|nr:30S ribosomal protein S3 [Clostridiales bacterium]
MGQKINPKGFRIGINKDWSSVWYSKKNFPKLLKEDYLIRKFVKKKLAYAGVSEVKIFRADEKIKLIIFSSKPGIIIGRNGQAITELTKEVQKMSDQKVSIVIEEIKRPELNAQLSAEDIAKQLENRVAFRRAMRQAITRTIKSGALGIKIAVSGRLAGADIARREHFHEGTVPLQTLRANIDYGFFEANTTYGKIGVKVWIYKGEIFLDKKIFINKNQKYRGDDKKNANAQTH